MSNRICSQSDCVRPHYAKGLCKPHYRRNYYQENGDRERANFRAWRLQNLEHEKARWKAYFAENAEELKAYRKAHYRANREAALQRAANYRAANPGTSDRWRKANPERWAMRNRENQRRRHNRGERRVDYAAILAEFGMQCHICGTPIPTFADLHFDHVIPLALGGPHHADNIRPSHARCNLQKGARLIA